MFEQTFVNSNAQTRRPWTVAVSLALQTILVAIALLAPLMHVAVLHRPERASVWLPQPFSPATKMKTEPQVRTAAPISRPVFHLATLQAPVTVPRRIDMVPDAPEIGNTLPSTPAGGSAVFGLLPGTTVQPPAQAIPPVKSQQPSQPNRVRVTSGVQSAKLIFAPKPAYPPLAKVTRTQGTVRIQAIIGRDGAIRNIEVLSGPPLLIAVAVEAFRQWRYQPTTLNGEAVEVITEIEVNFTLAQ